GEGLAFEVVVVGEGELAGVKVDLDEIGRAGIAVEAGTALDVNAEERGKLIEQAAVDGEVTFVGIEMTEAESLDREFEFVLVAGGEHEVASLFLGIRVAAEEA